MSLWLTDNHWLPCLSSLLNGSLLKARVLSDSNLCFLFSAQESKQNRFYWTFSTLKSHQFSHSVVSDSLRPYEPQHARPPCPSPAPGVYPNSCPLSRWCHLTISCSVVSFSSCLQSFPTSGSFKMSQLFASGGQSIGVFSVSIWPSNEYSGLISFRIDWFDLLAVQGTLESSPTPQFKDINSSLLRFLYSPTLTSVHDY